MEFFSEFYPLIEKINNDMLVLCSHKNTELNKHTETNITKHAFKTEATTRISSGVK